MPFHAQRQQTCTNWELVSIKSNQLRFIKCLLHTDGLYVKGGTFCSFYIWPIWYFSRKQDKCDRKRCRGEKFPKLAILFYFFMTQDLLPRAWEWQPMVEENKIKVVETVIDLAVGNKEGGMCRSRSGVTLGSSRHFSAPVLLSLGVPARGNNTNKSVCEPWSAIQS